jgi:hypothetical protein
VNRTAAISVAVRAGNQSARDGGRDAWNVEDFDLAVAVLRGLVFPEEGSGHGAPENRSLDGMAAEAECPGETAVPRGRCVVGVETS